MNQRMPRVERAVDRLMAAGFLHIDVTVDAEQRVLSMKLKRNGMVWHFGPGGDEW